MSFSTNLVEARVFSYTIRIMKPTDPLPSVKPLLAILATGGTIAAAPLQGSSITDYSSGKLSPADLLAAVPDVARHAVTRIEQISGIGSEDMTEEIWLRLLTAVKQELADFEVAGAVILHGTDTMEETGYFLNLTIDSDKPVVLTGAMRPAHASSADGPMNIFNAVRLAADPAAGGRGVLIAMNDSIHAARDVAKTDTLALDAFRSPDTGPLGRMVDGQPQFLRQTIRRHTTGSRFSSAVPEELPRVEIVYGHAGQRRDLVDAAVAAGARGIVHAGVGMGNIHRDVWPALTEAAAKGVAVACASRVGCGPVPEREAMRRGGLLSASDLNPQKARVLLQLALTRTRDTREIQEIFDTH